MRQKIAVMGAGSVGCYYGAMLALAGEDVVLIGRPAFSAQVTAGGLRFEKGGETITLPVSASSSPQDVAGAGLVLVCVKSQDSEAAAREIASSLVPDALVVSMQNGVGNAARLSGWLGREVLPAVVYVATDMAGPGHVRHHGRGELVLGEGAGAEALAARLRRAGIATEVSADTESALWSKLVINCAFNAVSALTAQPYGRIFAEPGAEALIRGLITECEAVAAATGVALPDDLWPQAQRIARTMPGQFSSTAQDRMRGRATEIDYLNGEILRRAGAAGIDVPLNNAVTVLLKLAEASPGV